MGYRELPSIEEMPAIFHEWLQWLPLYEDKPPHTVRAYSQGVRRVVSFADIPPPSFGADSLDQATLTDTVRAMRAAPDVSKSTITGGDPHGVCARGEAYVAIRDSRVVGAASTRAASPCPRRPRTWRATRTWRRPRRRRRWRRL